MQGDKRTTRECYLVGIQPLVNQRIEQRAPPMGKKARTRPLPPVTGALVIHIVTSTEPKRPRPETVDGVEQIPLKDARPDHMV